MLSLLREGCNVLRDGPVFYFVVSNAASPTLHTSRFRAVVFGFHKLDSTPAAFAFNSKGCTIFHIPYTIYLYVKVLYSPLKIEVYKFKFVAEDIVLILLLLHSHSFLLKLISFCIRGEWGKMSQWVS